MNGLLKAAGYCLMENCQPRGFQKPLVFSLTAFRNPFVVAVKASMRIHKVGKPFHRTSYKMNFKIFPGPTKEQNL
jgi:hypothetical protein